MTKNILHCPECNAVFVTYNNKKKYCSAKCFGLATRTRTAKNCLQCGVEFLSIPSKPGKYCSKPCHDAAAKAGSRKGQGRKNPPHNCAHCKKVFFGKVKRQRNGELQELYYCSRDCYLAVHTLNPTVPCAQCGVDVRAHRKEGLMRKYCSMECKVAHKRPKPANCKCCGVLFQGISFRRNTKGAIRSVYKARKTCSDKCHIQWITDNEERKRKIGLAFTGENSPHWKGGATVTNSRTGRCASKDWKAIAEKARKRDGYQCKICGMTQEQHGRKLDVHHIVPYHNFSKASEANRMSNLVTLCKACHMVEEHKIVERQAVLQIWQHG